MNIKKFTKIMLKIAGSVAILGVVCMIVAFAMGLTIDGFMKMLRDGRFAIKIKDGFQIEYEDGDLEGSVGLITGEENNDTAEGWTFYPSEEFNSIDLEFGAGVLDIHYDDVEDIQIYHENIKQFNAKVEYGVLKINTGHEVYIDDANNRQLVIILPTDMQLNEVDLEVAAAKAYVHGLMADNVSFTIGAGQADIVDIVTNGMEIEVGAGAAYVSNLSTNTLEVKCGMGQVELELCGAQSDYNCDIECGMGDVVVGDYSYGGVGTQHHGDNRHANKSIDVECGMGEVFVRFMDMVESI